MTNKPMTDVVKKLTRLCKARAGGSKLHTRDLRELLSILRELAALQRQVSTLTRQALQATVKSMEAR